MNFKSIAIAASLVLAAGASFAADIDMGGNTYASAPIADASALLAIADTSLTLGEAHDSNNAVIYQDDSIGGGALEQIAMIDQVGSLGGNMAMIVQLGNAAVAQIGYIAQVGTTNNKAVITQR